MSNTVYRCETRSRHKMSRRTAREYCALKREEYRSEQFARKGSVLDEIRRATGHSRKQVTQLPNGKIRF